MNERQASSWWRFVALMTAFNAAWGVSIGPAVFGHQQWMFGGPVGALVGVLVGSRSRDSAFWRLPLERRHRVVVARRTGTPTWEPDLDLVAREQLRQAARHARSRWPVAVSLIAFAVAVPAVAAVRTGTGWYALAIVPMLTPALLAVRVAALEDPQRRLTRLEAAMSAGPPVEVRPAGTGR